jgi:aryl-alcohol dehydrogenase-like predicted oxidoreductase
MPVTALGRSDLRVSRLALGSWRTYERISRDQGVRVMRAAREAGINFLDDARYNDETGHAPLPTGYSEVVFGELFRASGWRRDEAVVSNKLWWEFWPDQSPAQELAGSLGRMGLDHIDLIYSEVPPDGVGLEDAVDMITGLIRAGAARAWGTLNWTPVQMERAWQIADREGVPGPVATQPPYSLVRREIVDDPAMRRVAAIIGQPQWAGAVAAGRDLAALARDIGVAPASLAMAFALLDPSVTTVLFGATRPEQVRANLGALALAERLTPGERDRLAAIGVGSGP